MYNLHVLTLCICALVSVSGVDVGFSLLFTSNKEEIEHAAITFSPPLPFPLNGTYMKNGVGLFSMGGRSFLNALDGFAKLYSITFDGRSNLNFSCKFLQTNFYQDSIYENDIASYTLFDGTKPPFGIFRKLFAMVNTLDNPNINIIRMQSGEDETKHEFTTIGDIWGGYSVDKSSLDTLAAAKPSLSQSTFFNRFIPVGTSAHPVQENGTTNYITFFAFTSVTPGTKSRLEVTRVKSLKSTEMIAEINLDRIPYMHSLALSENHAVLFAHPMFLSMDTLLTKGALRSMSWEASKDTTVYVVNIHNGDIITLSTEARFNMHHVNSYESGSKIYVDMTTYDDIGVLKGVELDKMLDPDARNDMPTNGKLVRYTIDLEASTVEQHSYKSKPSTAFISRLDMPAINENYRFRRHCFIYGMVIKIDGVHTATDALVKMNVCDPTGQSDMFWAREDHYVSEPWFIPHPEAKSEDDGILVCEVLNGTTGTSLFMVFDAKTLIEISQAELPIRIPTTLHGRYFALEPPESINNISISIPTSISNAIQKVMRRFIWSLFGI